MKYSYNDLEREYNKAVAEGVESFKFLGKYDLLVAYAKYLLEHLGNLVVASRLEKSDEVWEFIQQERDNGKVKEEQEGKGKKRCSVLNQDGAEIYVGVVEEKHTEDEVDSIEHEGAVCKRCGRTVTEAEWSCGTSKCCKKEVVDESEAESETDQ